MVDGWLLRLSRWWLFVLFDDLLVSVDGQSRMVEGGLVDEVFCMIRLDFLNSSDFNLRYVIDNNREKIVFIETIISFV